ncbi:MAG: GNAT family N-acetyltransferase, partial [Candidatus Eiseniibacteriota bacterium]
AATKVLHDYLETTSVPPYLLALPDAAARERWAESTFAAIRCTGYTLADMLAHRVATIGGRPLFEEYGASPPPRWSYAQVQRRARAIAAVFLEARGADARVALLVDNSVDGASCDLACLLHDIVVAPLNVHFNLDELCWIFRRLGITIAVADTEDRLRRLLEVRRRLGASFTLYALQSGRVVEQDEAVLLGETTAHLSTEHVESVLAARPRRALDEIGTVMFTSGSTGRPKGVAFTPFNLISKRFARAAALPAVGQDEKLLCFLPLFHTFGRYLEMLGMLFWRGTYVFAGNPSTGTLFAGLHEVQPTGLISVPIRWVQIRDHCLERAGDAASSEEREAIFRQVVGNRLRWGLSAAGHLEPRVFRYFQRRGVELASGFGMTEATGGITMSPPGDYVDGTVGTRLPGIRLRFTDEGEMQIAGAYVARYLTEEGEGLETVPGIEADGEEWLTTGDLFRELARGHLTIVDRIKDIYKNNRGQTVAPRRVEQLLEGVPGIRRAFLVGDNRAYNVLLIVPDQDDPVLRDAPDAGSRHEYFRQIVAAANQDLAPYERVINFTLIDRDFEIEREELTPKGTYRRKAIEQHFADQIEALYQRSFVELRVGALRVQLPRWFHRDLGILENDITVDGERLVDRQRHRELALVRDPASGMVRIGDLEYAVAGDTVDLGLLARQPRLWLGNPALVAFAPCKEGWDASPGPVSLNVLLPPGTSRDHHDTGADPTDVSDPRLVVVNRLLQLSLFASRDRSLSAVLQLKGELVANDDRFGATVRRRLTALARHDDEEVRCLAYRVLLLDDPEPDYDLSFPAFVQSGLSFLNESSLKCLASAQFEKRRLEALRRRFYAYRRQLEWPASEEVRRQFEYTLRMLVNFVHRYPEYYNAVRIELGAWVLHRQDPQLAESAQRLLDGLVVWFGKHLEARTPPLDPDRLERLVAFDEDISETARGRLRHLLVETTFLKQSVILAFDEQDFELDDVVDGGIWVSRLRTRGTHTLDRVSINTKGSRHFELLVIQRRDMNAAAVQRTNYWMATIAGFPFGQRAVPRFGCTRPELAAMSLEYISQPTVEEKIRELASQFQSGLVDPAPGELRKLMVRAMSTLFVAWRHSGRQVVPETISPANVVVPEQDFHEGSLILSLAGWDPYRHTFDLFRPLHTMFYRRTRAHYPVIAGHLRDTWIFDACVEALGESRALELLRRLRADIDAADATPFGQAFTRELDRFLATAGQRYYLSLPLVNAIDRYHAWLGANPGVERVACADQVEGLERLYRLDRLGDAARYHLYRHTYFADASRETHEAYDRLLESMQRDPSQPPTRLVELSELQATLASEQDLDVFARLVFPRAHRPPRVEVVTFGERQRKQVTVRTRFTDERGETFDIREPIHPEEVGQVYRLFYEEHFPKTVSEQDRYLVATDEADRVIGAICYQLQEHEVVHMEGVVVNASFTGRGIATALLEDFVTRMASQGARVVKTGFIMRAFCEKRGFRLDRRWGGLVRWIVAPEEAERRAPEPPDVV